MNLLSETEEHYEGRSPSGAWRDGYTTYREPDNSPVARAIFQHIERSHRNVWMQVRHEPLELTVHNCWSGYSEYTITNTWSEVSVKWGPFELHFDSMPAFFRALAETEEAA